MTGTQGIFNMPVEELYRQIESSTKFAISDFLLLGSTWNFVEIGGDIEAFEWSHVAFDYKNLFSGIVELEESDYRLGVKLGNVSGCELILFITASGSQSHHVSVNGTTKEVDVECLIEHLRNAFEDVVMQSSGETNLSFELHGREGMRIFASDWSYLGQAFGQRLSSSEFFADKPYPKGSRAYFASRKIGYKEEWDTDNEVHNMSFLPRLKPQNALKKYVKVAMDHVLKDGHLWFPEKHFDTGDCQAVNVGLLRGVANQHCRQMVGYEPIVALRQSYRLFDNQFACTWFFECPAVAKDLLCHLAKKLETEDDVEKTLCEIDKLGKRVDIIEKAVQLAFSPSQNHGSRTTFVYVEEGNISRTMAELFRNAGNAGRNFADTTDMLAGHNYYISPLQPYVQSLLEITRKLFQTIRHGIACFRSFCANARPEEEEVEIQQVSDLISGISADIYVSEALLCRILKGEFPENANNHLLEAHVNSVWTTDVDLGEWPFNSEMIRWNKTLNKLTTSVEIQDLIESVGEIFTVYANKVNIFSSGSDKDELSEESIYIDMDVGAGPCMTFPRLPFNFENDDPVYVEPQVSIHQMTQKSMVKCSGNKSWVKPVRSARRTNETFDRSLCNLNVIMAENNKKEDSLDGQVFGDVDSTNASAGSTASSITSAADHTYEEIILDPSSSNEEEEISYSSSSSSSSRSSCCFPVFFKRFTTKNRAEKRKIDKELSGTKSCQLGRIFSTIKKFFCI